jgi:adenylate kinase family enzyme
MIDKDIRVVILGNSASGKSTLARQLAKRFSIARLVLDTLAWLPMGSLAKKLQRAPLGESMVGINAFMQTQKNWLIEGCYSDLLGQVLPVARQQVSMDFSIQDTFSHIAH